MKYQLALHAVLAFLLTLGTTARLDTRDSSELDPVARSPIRLKWPRRTIEISFSTSLANPGTNIKRGSDVVGAARRALGHWSALANLNFVVTWSELDSVSPASRGDGVSLITVSDTPENESFNAQTTTARTRVFFDPESGSIAEADIAINPHPRSESGADLQFSTDGTPGTYDLESTFTHEVGHLLGLDHSSVLGSTMQSRQAFNGMYGQPAFTERTLSEDDRQRVRSLYGPTPRSGRIEGRLIDNQHPDTLSPDEPFNVWAENITTGRVIASSVTSTDGMYRLDGLPAGQYRVIAARKSAELSATENSPLTPPAGNIEVSDPVNVRPDTPASLNFTLVANGASQTLAPRWIGLNGELSSVALPIEPGKRVKIFLAGAGVDQVPVTSIGVTSPYFNVDPGSLAREPGNATVPMISFDLNVAPNAPFGEYTLRLQSTTGEIAYLPGALTVDPAAASTVLNPLDDVRFLIAQQYSDLAGYLPTPEVLEKLSTPLAQCGGRADCVRSRRVDLSSNLYLQNALGSASLLINGLYLAALGRRPHLAEFENDRNRLAADQADGTGEQDKLILSFVRRAEFERKYSSDMTASRFVEAVIATTLQMLKVDLAADKENLLRLFDGTDRGRAAVITQIINNPRFVDAEYNQTFVQGQYFGYLRRDPDDAGLNFWVNVLKGKPLRDPDAARSLTCAFLNSSEYQLRFGLFATHSGSECN